MYLARRPPFDTGLAPRWARRVPMASAPLQCSHYTRNATPLTLEHLHNKFRDDYLRSDPIYHHFSQEPYKCRSAQYQAELQRRRLADAYWDERARVFRRPLIEQREFVKLKPQLLPQMERCAGQCGFRRRCRQISDGLE